MDTIYSYIPLLDDPALIEDTDHNEIVNQYPDGRSNYCCWSEYESQPLVALVYKNAEEIYDHIMRFSKNQPNEYFDIELVFNDHGYAVGLIPNIEHNLIMTNKTRMMMGKAPVSGDVKLIYSPLHFFHQGPTEANLEINDTLIFGLMDESDLNNSNNCLIVDQFNISLNNIFVDSIMEQIVAEAENH